LSGTVTAQGTGERSLWPLWAMFAIFALPVAAGWVLHLNPELLPAARGNRGELIEPPRPWPNDLALARLDGSRFDIGALAGRWTLVTVTHGPCESSCRAKAGELRQIRLAMGEGGLAVERLLVLAGDAGPSTETIGALAGTEVIRADSAALRGLSAFFGPDEDIWDRVYVVDPLGNLMMRYAVLAPPKDVLKDMERLLKASRNWIKGAGYGHR
jgi:hypothetical protein